MQNCIPDPSILYAVYSSYSYNPSKWELLLFTISEKDTNTASKYASECTRWVASLPIIYLCTYLRAFCAFEKSVEGEARVQNAPAAYYSAAECQEMQKIQEMRNCV